MEYAIPNLQGLQGESAVFADGNDQSLAAPAKNNLWVVGGFQHQPGPDHRFAYYTPMIDRFNGTSWSFMAAPAPPEGTTSFSLHEVAASSPTNVWIAGSATTNGRASEAYLARWDGDSWHELALPSRSITVGALAVTGPDDVWISADADSCGTASTAFVSLYHWNGTSWQRPWIGNDCGELNEYYVNRLFSPASGAVRQLGYLSVFSPFGTTPSTSCFGSPCVACPAPACDSSWGVPYAATGTPSDMWIVGGGNKQPSPENAPFAAHYADGVWTDESPPITPRWHILAGATVLGNGNLWAVGNRFPELPQGGDIRTLIMQRAADGTWTDLGGVSFEAYGQAEQSWLNQVVHMPHTATQMWAAGYREPEYYTRGRFGGFLLYHP